MAHEGSTLKVTVVGGGTAGLVAAISLKHRMPGPEVVVVRSSELGTIMVGEGTFAETPLLLHEAMGIPRKEFFDAVNPIWKLGVRLRWGPRPYFDYPFSEQFDNQVLPTRTKPWGYYHLDDLLDGNSPRAAVSLSSPRAGYHVENGPLVEFLERHFVAAGGTIVDAKVVSVNTSTDGVGSIVLDTGETHHADFFVDATGFRAELISKALGEPFVSMADHLFCDRAVVGGWTRTDEPILPYTTMETMTSGWCWQIEHEHVINRGYVFSSAYLDDDAAAQEFGSRNPKVDPDALRLVPFAARHIRRAWVGNVVAIGNACGFVEPLEATNIQVFCMHALRLAEDLAGAGWRDRQIPERYNEFVDTMWVHVRDFLALHYRFNERLSTPFWEMATHDTPLGHLEEYVEEYMRHGPVLHADHDGKPEGMFGYDGPLAILLGLRVPWAASSIR